MSESHTESVQPVAGTAGRPGLSRTACERCRNQKLRCSREHPVCERCSRLAASCHYPRLVDRKLLARRARPSGTHPTSRFSSGQTSPLRCAPPLIDVTGSISSSGDLKGRNYASMSCIQEESTSQPSVLPSHPAVDAQGAGLHLGISPRQTTQFDLPTHNSKELPPRAIGLGLLDIYFERIYNADLIFSQTEFFQSYLNGEVPAYVLRAVFALASLFLNQPEIRRPRLVGPVHSSELMVLAPYANCGRDWAEAASQEALLQADRPSLQTIQTFECLTIYWFAAGETNRAIMHSVVAYTASSTLCLPPTNLDNDMDEVTIFREERKRCVFWSCWATMCISAMPVPMARSAWAEVAGVPLPATPDQLRSAEGFSSIQSMDMNWNCIFRGPTTESGHDSSKKPSATMPEYLKLIGIWARVQIVSRNASGPPDFEEAEALSVKAQTIYDSSTFPPHPPETPVSAKELARTVALHSLYHLCQMAVRCPLVSLFSGQPQDPGVSRDRTRVNAEVVCKHALMHCMLIRDYVSREGDITRLSSLVGFASFVATSILLALARSEARRRGNEDGLIQASNQFLQLVQDTMNLLDVLKIYWQPLVLMATKLQKSVDGTLKVRNVPFGISCMDEVRAIQVPVTGVNSPTENQEDIIATVYVENLAPGRDVAESILRADAVQQRGAEPAPCVQDEGDLFLGGSNELDLHHIIPGISEDFFCTSLDYSDLDLGPIYPTQMA